MPKINADLKPEYLRLKEELLRLKALEGIDRMKVEVLERTIFHSLPQVCTRCGETKHLTLDHLVPKYWLQQLGVDTERETVEGNYQILCRYCNQKKASMVDIREKGVKEILKKLIERL